MSSKTILSATFALATLLPLAVMAQSPNWTYLEVSYADTEIDELESRQIDLSEPDGFEVAGSLGIGELIYVDLSYSEQSSDGLLRVGGNTEALFGTPKIELDFDRISAGVGIIWDVTETTDIYGHLGYEDWSVQLSAQRYRFGESEQFDDNGLSAAVGIRSVLLPSLEVRGEVGYNDIVEEASFMAGAYYTFVDHFTIGGSFEKIDELETLRATARYQF